MRGLGTPGPGFVLPAVRCLGTSVTRRWALLIAASRVPAADGPAPRPTDREAVGRGSVGGGGGPEEAGQLAGAGDDGDVVVACRGPHRVRLTRVQALLGAVGDRQDVVGLAGLAVGQRRAEPRLAAVVPGRLDQQPAGERRPGLGDRALP